MNEMPNDPIMLMSYLNTKLRDQYASLDILCEDLQLDPHLLAKKLAEAGFKYNPQTNKFW